MNIRLGVIFPCLALTACEGDENKLARLQEERRVAELRVWGWGKNTDPERKGYADSLRAARNRLLLIDRDIERILGGR